MARSGGDRIGAGLVAPDSTLALGDSLGRRDQAFEQRRAGTGSAVRLRDAATVTPPRALPKRYRGRVQGEKREAMRRRQRGVWALGRFELATIR